MHSVWLSRLFFAVVGAVAFTGLISGAACTRWGTPGNVPPTVAPLSSIYVDANIGSDTSGNGSSTKPYKTMSKAVAVLASSKSLSPAGVTINLASGDYNAANGEKFPIIIPTNVSITGANYGTGVKSGAFIDGLGEDTIFERLVHAPQHSQYVTLEVLPPANVNIGNVYVGASKVHLPNSGALFASLDVIGAVNSSVATFGAGIVSTLRNIAGVVVASGSFSCGSCLIHGNYFGIGALTVPLPTSSPNSAIPSINLTHATGDAVITAKTVDIITDGSANVTASGQTFAGAAYAFEDSLRAIVSVPLRGAIDFGGGAGASNGGNDFIGARVSEIAISRSGESVFALDDVWNPKQQRANQNGQYAQRIVFASGTTGKNVTVRSFASGSLVTVGPAPVPTPTPSPTPSGSPSPSPTPTKA